MEPTPTDRQMYQLHKEGYEKMASAFKDMAINAKAEVDVNVKVEVIGGTVEAINLTDDEEENA
jgi:hypothetical protein